MEEQFAMTGGDGPNSYAKNSISQRKAAARAAATLVAAISENLDIEIHGQQSTIFRVADLGCSVGPNTFIQVKNIIDAVAKKYENENKSSTVTPEFQVYFSDLVSNDFNYLFATLPQDRQYFAAGVPGSFHGRLFPRACLNFVYSAYALHWLSKLPQELRDTDSPAFNKKRILYANAPREVGEAYSAQYGKGMEAFFRARGQELAPGGLMVLLMPGRPEGTVPAESSLAPFFEPLESTLSDMVNEGLIREDKFETFNLPLYCPSVEELTELIEENGCFDLLKLEIQPPTPISLATVQELRAGMETLLRKHFGDEIIELIFERYSKKFFGGSTGAPLVADDGKAVGFFVLLKRRYL